MSSRQAKIYEKPEIRKLGTIDCDIVETTPIVFNGVPYRFEYIREKYWANNTGMSYFRFVEHDTGRTCKPFAHGYHLGNVMVVESSIIVTGTNRWGGESIDLFLSHDMENWEKRSALNLPGYMLFNTSICQAETQTLLMFEVGKQIDGDMIFFPQFATSSDMKMWQLMPPECTYGADRYAAPHCLRYLDGYYYNFYLESRCEGYEQFVVRSRNLIDWESSPLNPVLKACDKDRLIINSAITLEQRNKIQTAVNCNNSDLDFCEYKGYLIINYSWGDQKGIEFLAEAIYDGTTEQFLRGWFPSCMSNGRHPDWSRTHANLEG